MLALLITVAVFSTMAVLVLRWAADDFSETGTLSGRSVVASWLLYVFHADTVATAALIGALAVDVPRTAALIGGAALAVCGFGVFVAATVALARHGDLAGPRTRRLVIVGPYRRSRHPQNLGWAVMLLGIAVAGRSIVALALVALFAAFVDRYARLEEEQLHRDFGDSYNAYRAGTPAVVSLAQMRPARMNARRRTDGT